MVLALADIHEKDIMHLDSHPGNWVTDDKGQLTLVDFGCA